MAIYHCKVTIISRSTGRSSVGAAAYRAGECLTNERDGRTHDYTRKGGVTHTEIIAPDNAPEWARDREKLWNEVEKAEKSIDAQLCREVEVALPAELNPEQQKELVRDYVKENFVDHGMIADVAIHDKGDGNPHAHILLTMREVDREGNWQAKCKKEYELDKDGNKQRLPSGNYKCRRVDANDWNKKEALERWREGWEKSANRHLERAGHETRIDRRSLEAQGIEREPQIHEGRARVIQKKEAKRGKTVELERSKLNREIKERNEKFKKLDRQQQRYTRNVERILKKAEKIKDLTEVRTEAGAEKVQAKNEQKRLDLKTVDNICVREADKLRVEITKLDKEIAELRRDIMPPENIRKAAERRYLGKEILDELKKHGHDQRQFDAAGDAWKRDNAQYERELQSVGLLDLKRKFELEQTRKDLTGRWNELKQRGQELDQRGREINVRIRERMAEPDAEQKIRASEHKISEASRDGDKKVTALENQRIVLEERVAKWEDLRNQVEPQIKRLGRAQIIINGPMEYKNFHAQARSQLAKLLRNHPAPQRVRGRTQARIADDDDPSKKRGKGLDI